MIKRYAVAIATLAVLVGGIFVIAPQVGAVPAFNTSDNGDVTLSKDTVQDGAYYAAGQDIIIDGTINGDLYCAGQTVRINGTVKGDVICGAQKITINGTVGQDVRLAGQIVTVNGQVGGTLTSFAQDVKVSKGATIGGDVNGAAQTVTIDGTVKQDVALGAQKLTISGKVDGDAVVSVESLSLTAQPAIAGVLEYHSTQEQQFDTTAVGGKVTFTQVDDTSSAQSDYAAAAVKAALFIVLMLIVSSVVLSLFIPRTFERSYAIVRRKMSMVVLVGVAVSLGLPILAVLLLVTVIGAPLGLLAVVTLMLLYLLAFPFVAYYLGRALFGKVIHNILLLMTVGAVLLSLLLLIPVLNFIVTVVMMVIGIGGVVVTVTNGYQKPGYGIVPDAQDIEVVEVK